MSRFFVCLSVFLLGLLCGCASSAKKYAPRCSLRSKAITKTFESRIQRIRADGGLKPLAWDYPLRRAAQKQSNYLALIGNLEHGRGGGPLVRLRKLGISRQRVGENIARVIHDDNPALTTIRYWTGRKTELANLKNPEFFRMGLGVTASEKHCYSVLVLSE